MLLFRKNSFVFKHKFQHEKVTDFINPNSRDVTTPYLIFPTLISSSQMSQCCFPKCHSYKQFISRISIEMSTFSSNVSIITYG